MTLEALWMWHTWYWFTSIFYSKKSWSSIKTYFSHIGPLLMAFFSLNMETCIIPIISYLQYVLQIEDCDWIFIDRNPDADGESLGIQNQSQSIFCFALMSRSKWVDLYRNAGLPSSLPTAHVHRESKSISPLELTCLLF